MMNASRPSSDSEEKGSIYFSGAARIINPRRLIPIHCDDYDVFESPLEDFQTAAELAGLEERVTCLSRGDTCRFSIRQLERMASL